MKYSETQRNITTFFQQASRKRSADNEANPIVKRPAMAESQTESSSSEEMPPRDVRPSQRIAPQSANYVDDILAFYTKDGESSGNSPTLSR